MNSGQCKVLLKIERQCVCGGGGGRGGGFIMTVVIFWQSMALLAAFWPVQLICCSNNNQFLFNNLLLKCILLILVTFTYSILVSQSLQRLILFFSTRVFASSLCNFTFSCAHFAPCIWRGTDGVYGSSWPDFLSVTVRAQLHPSSLTDICIYSTYRLFSLWFQIGLLHDLMCNIYKTLAVDIKCEWYCISINNLVWGELKDLKVH